MNRVNYIFFVGVFLFVLISIPIIPEAISQNTSGQENFSNILISTSDAKWPQHVEPTMVFGKNETIYAGWKNANTFDGGGLSVSFSYSTDLGNTWSNPITMPAILNNSSQSDPWMQYFNGTLYYCYLDYNEALGISQVVVSRTSDNGKIWESVLASHARGFADKESFTIDNKGNIYVVYDDIYPNGSDSLRIIQSFDGGKTFNDNVIIPKQKTGVYLGGYIIAGKVDGSLYIGYDQFGNSPQSSDIIFAKSTDYGNTWENGIALNTPNNETWSTAGSDGYPSIATFTALKQDNNGRIYIVWNQLDSSSLTKIFNVYMRYSDDGGNTWSNKFLISDSTINNQWEPTLDIGSNNIVHLAYYDNSSTGGYNLKYRTFDPITSKLSPEVIVTNILTPGKFTRPGDYLTIKVANNIPYIVWSDGRSNSMDIYFGTLVKNNSNTSTSNNNPSTSPTNNNSNTSTNNGFLLFHYYFILLLIPISLIKKKKSEIKK